MTKKRYFSTTSMLCDRYLGFLPLHRKPTKCFKGACPWIAPCLSVVMLHYPTFPDFKDLNVFALVSVPLPKDLQSKHNWYQWYLRLSSVSQRATAFCAKQKTLDAGKQKSAAVFLFNERTRQCRLPPSFGLHPQKCVLHWWEGTQEFSLFQTWSWLNIRIERFVVYWSVQRISSVACWHCNLLCQSRFCASRLCLLYWRICYIEVRYMYIEVLFNTFYCNFLRDTGYCLLHRGLH